MERSRGLSAAACLIALGRRMEDEPGFPVKAAAGLLRVRDREGKLRRLIANPAQMAFEEKRGRQNIVLKARQMGVTTWVAGRFFLRTITMPGTRTLLVAHTREAAEGIFQAVQRMWVELPEDMRQGALKLRRQNAGQMVFEEMDSEFRVASAGDENAGRGLSLQNLHCSEVSRWPGDAAATLAGLRAALAPGGEMVMESTPNGAYGAFYEAWLAGVDGGVVRAVQEEEETAGPYRMTSKMVGMTSEMVGMTSEMGHADGVVRHFLPWWMEPSYVGAAADVGAMSEEESGLVERYGLSAEQIGFRRGLESRYGVLRSQEFAEDAETCFRATGMCCFDVKAIERRMAEVPEVLEARRGGALLVWFRAVPGREYVVAVDSAGGGEEGDFAAVQVIDRETGMQCAELQQRLRPAELARVAVELAKEYGGAVIAVERNNHGAAVLAYLETSEHYERVWRARGASEAGWLTTAVSKPEMVARLGSLLEKEPGRFMSRRLLGECRTFVAGERGRTSAASGAHDDLVMGMAVGQAVRQEVGSRK